MKRRSNREGSIYQRKNGYWCVEVIVGMKADGKPLKKTVYCKSNEEAVETLKALNKDLIKKKDFRAGGEAFALFIHRWLKDSVKHRVRQNTLDSYVTLIKQHIIPELGTISIGDIKTSDVQALYDKLSQSGKSSSLIHKVHTLISASLKTALPDGIIDRDPTQGTRRPPVKSKRKNLFTDKQAEKFLDTAMRSNSQFKDMLLVYWELGGRISEVLGLKWKHVGENFVKIESVIMQTRNGVKDSEPKTDASRRTVYLSKDAMDAINRQPHRLIATNPETNPEIESETKKGKPSEYVFTTASGKPQSHRNWRRQWDAWLVAAFGSEPQEDKTKPKKPIVTVSPHALRHMQAVHLIRQGWSVADVQQRGGWDSPKVLMEIYANHSTKERQEKMAQAARLKKVTIRVVKNSSEETNNEPISVKTSVK